MTAPTCTPVPAGFAETFDAGGWRAIERRYHAQTESLVRWYRATVAQRYERETA